MPDLSALARILGVASEVDVRDDYAANIDALIARLGAVRGAR